VVQQVVEQGLLLRARPSAALSEVECCGSKQQIDYLESVSRAGVETAHAYHREPTTGPVDRVRHVALELHGRRGASAIGKNSDDLLVVNDLSKHSRGKLLVRALARVWMPLESGRNVAVLPIGNVAAESRVVRGEEQIHHCLCEVQPGGGST
jgi:hypothetical protein